ncbi:unnamed protein product [Ranitomeya imitator]|uniref:G-protein coupled receptors family 1 profile domain-containing protein n=1 Tax=Ranitomeya imitator TaxID=111125 RepID=A0ABN9LNA8_9NEOB|nr:unnamed protein product [Ranitomeya imitator]
MENQNHSSNTTRDPLKRNEEVAKVEVTVLALILFLALAGNICVLLGIYINRHKHSRMYFFMKHLSIADLVVALFQVLPQLIWDITFRFYAPDFVCRLVTYLQVVGMFASTYMLLLMSLDRCLAICQPLRSLHRRSDCVYVLFAWILSFLLSTPQTVIFSLTEVGNGVYDCRADFIQPWGPKAYITWITLAVYIIPVMILSICYGLISYKIWQNIRLKTVCESNLRLSTSRRATLSRVSSVRLISKAKIRTVKMTFIIVLAYVVCWTPFFFVQMWSVWDPNPPKEDAHSPLLQSTIIQPLFSASKPRRTPQLKCNLEVPSTSVVLYGPSSCHLIDLRSPKYDHAMGNVPARSNRCTENFSRSFSIIKGLIQLHITA